eukprot:TRINITY_DN4132_c0_g3_i1.p1 TRINITY_DN4132_c0_g3~~TRINITY_DN4132_c0_g3_i1.p1  ORF type:complete len:333 (-),score=118.49 TRINITY_DN4132_c0_g3_i1:104-1102(-)
MSQSSQQRESAQVRTMYRKMLNKYSDEKAELLLPDSEGIDKSLDLIDKLFEKVRNPREGVLDAELLRNISEYSVEQAQRIKTHLESVDPSEYVSKLLKAYLVQQEEDEEEEEPIKQLDWAAIGKRSLSFMRTAPAQDFMLGAMKVNPPARRVVQRQRRQQDEIGEKVRPAEDPKVEENAANETTRKVNEMSKRIVKMGAEEKDMMDFISGNDFTESVLNLFHLSFLIKQGHVGTRVKDGRFTIHKAEPPKDTDYSSGVITTKQFVFRLDFDAWQQEKQQNRLPQTQFLSQTNEEEVEEGEEEEEEEAEGEEEEEEEEEEEPENVHLAKRRKR